MRARWDWTWVIPLAVAGVLLGVVALGRMAIGVEAIAEAQQVDYGEPIVYGAAARLVAGQQLYQPLDRPPFTVAAYTPLYYILAAAGQVSLGPGFAPGRTISFVACLATSLGIAWLVIRQTRSAWAGLFAALMFVGLGFPGTVPWFAVYRVDVLGAALSLGAIVVLAHGNSTRHLMLAGLLAGLALLTKQSYLAATLAGTVWLWSHGPRRALLFGGSALLLAASVALIEEIRTGAFIANAIVANANPLSLEQVGALLPIFGQTLLLPLAIALAYACLGQPWPTALTRLLAVYWLATVLQLLGTVKFGATYNYWVEFAAATSILATLGLWAAATQIKRFRAVSRGLAWLFAANMLVFTPASAAAAATGLGDGTALTRLQPTNTSEFQGLVELVRHESGPVLADPLDVVVLAGHPVLLEPMIFSLLEHYGAWDPEPLASRICAGGVQLLVLGFPIDVVAGSTLYGELWWPPRIMRALKQCMRPAGQRANRYLYVPAGGGTANPFTG